ncbi:sensor histidine kinase YesM [Algoriphagus sp. 4150]|uniref:sensor histidine kinase n=1 Tax=Algoriphagus sp. 4150 TaxID=2817756 RepID=UPI00285FECC2|nr:histidine kinase [Algoriphagus sp. 4150]MDR7131846.1 sensor histidine kinase YesM [Algoriphagus sp. 4150]
MSNSEKSSVMEKDWVYRFFVSSDYRLARHISLIIFITLVLFNSLPQFIEPVQSIINSGLVLVFVLLFYLNMYWYVPRFFFTDRYFAYALSVISTIAIISAIYFFSWDILASYRRADAYREAAGFLSVSFVVLMLTMASTAIKLFQRSVLDSLRINELEKTTLRSEMEQLKNQINPHFLFNMLNNANVLTQKDPVKASQVLMKLSDLLRYQLYDSARSSVLLTAEIHFLEDFLNLEQIRRDNFEYLVSKQGELSWVQIAPLLLITFVENAIKHNVDLEKKSYVHLYFDVSHNQLLFKCINSKPRIVSKKTEVGGLGLANVKRRLELIYPAKHALQIEDNTDTYSVSLTISL